MEVKTAPPAAKQDAKASRLPKPIPSNTRTARPKQVVSAAGIFKQKHVPLRQGKVLQTARSAKGGHQDHGHGETPESSKDLNPILTGGAHKRSSSSPSSKDHPLAVEFNEITAAYRQHVLQDITSTIDEGYAAARKKLHRLNTLQAPKDPQDTTKTNPDGGQKGPATEEYEDITILEAFERDTTVLSWPLGAAQLRIYGKDAAGNSIEFHPTLEERMQDFSAKLAEEERQMQALEQEWEGVIGEIVKLGSSVLGEKTVAKFLRFDLRESDDRVKAAKEAPPPQGNDDEDDEDDEMTLVNDDTILSVLPPSKEKPKKRVTFTPPPAVAPPAPPSIPAFIKRPSRFPQQLHALPEVDKAKISGLEKRISALGRKQLADLNELAKEEKKAWNEKQKKIVQVLESI